MFETPQTFQNNDEFKPNLTRSGGNNKTIQMTTGTQDNGLSRRKLKYFGSEKEVRNNSIQRIKNDEMSTDSECEFSVQCKLIGNRTVLKQVNTDNVQTQSQSFDTPKSKPKASSQVKKATTSFQFDIDSTVASTSMSPYGDYLVAGFTNGVVRIYPLVRGGNADHSVTTPDFNATDYPDGIVMGQIQARGMYTSLNVHVEVSKDGKYVFAGVYRGSTEMLVFEMSSFSLPSSHTQPAKVTSYSYSDAKLKGFGAVCGEGSSYYLLCGLGIKNMHLWRFSVEGDKDTWECILDKQTNGITIEYLGFRNNQVASILSRSQDQNLRVWDASECIREEEDRPIEMNLNIPYEDIPNTKDCRTVVGDFTYGGTERVVVVELSTKARTEIDLIAGKEMSGSRRRRQIREIKQVVGGSSRKSPNALVLCSDGKLLFHHQNENLGAHAPLVPLDFGLDRIGTISLVSINDIVVKQNETIHPSHCLPSDAPVVIMATEKHVYVDTAPKSLIESYEAPKASSTPKICIFFPPVNNTSQLLKNKRSVVKSQKLNPQKVKKLETKVGLKEPKVIPKRVQEIASTSLQFASPPMVKPPVPAKAPTKPEKICTPPPLPVRPKPQKAKEATVDPPKTKPKVKKINNPTQAIPIEKIQAITAVRPKKRKKPYVAPIVSDETIKQLVADLASERRSLVEGFKIHHNRLWQSFKDELNRQRTYQQCFLQDQEVTSAATFLSKKQRVYLEHQNQRLRQNQSIGVFANSTHKFPMYTTRELVSKYQQLAKDLVCEQNFEARGMLAQHKFRLQCIVPSKSATGRLALENLPMDLAVEFAYEQELEWAGRCG